MAALYDRGEADGETIGSPPLIRQRLYVLIGARGGSRLMLHQAAKSLVVMAVAVSLAVIPVDDAQARRGRGIAVGIAVGIIALAIIGAEASRPRYKRRHRQIERQAQEPGPGPQAEAPECEWRGRTCYKNSYGTNVCEGGEYVCRPQ